jgi:prophage regulatory protein
MTVMFNVAQKGKNMTANTRLKPAPATLPQVGMSRWEQLRHFIPVSRETWRQLVKAGKAPKPVRLTERCTMYDNGAVHRWLAAPTDFRAEV